MLKTMITLMRGSAAAASEDIADRGALLILDQQMRDVQGRLGRAQRALAVALAEDAQDARREAGRQARALFAGEIGRMRRLVGDAGRRLSELQRGRRVARVADAVRLSRHGRIDPGGPARCTLPEAEQTLARLRERQSREAHAEDLLDGLTAETRPQAVEERLAEAGFGPATRPTAAAVLARLKQTIDQGVAS